jgi:hypothetical protein
MPATRASEFDFEVETDDAWAIEPLGPTIQRFRPSATVLFYRTLPGVAFIGFGYCFLVEESDDSLRGLPALGIALGLIALGLVPIVFALCDVPLSVFLCERGFYYDRVRTRRVFPWKRIREVREDIARHYRSEIDRMAGRLYRVDTSFLVMNVEGQTFQFGGGEYGLQALPLESALREAAARLGFAWKVSERDVIPGPSP